MHHRQFSITFATVLGLSLACGEPHPRGALEDGLSADMSTSHELADGVAAYNAFVKRTWSRVSEYGTRAAQDSIYALADDEDIRDPRNLRIDLSTPPGIRAEYVPCPESESTCLDFELDVPRAGEAWNIGFRFSYDVKLLGWKTFDVELEDLRISVRLLIDVSGPEPRIVAMPKPEISFELDIDSTNVITGAIVELLEGRVNARARDEISKGVDAMWPSMAVLNANRENGLGAAPPTGVSTTIDAPMLEDTAYALSDMIQRDHLPADTLVAAVLEAGDDIDSEPIAYGSFGDSSIWTGHYLAAESFRYAVTRDKGALAGIETGLRGFDKLTTASGTSGLLLRYVFPEDSPVPAAVAGTSDASEFLTVEIDGRTHTAWGHPTRDQYLGAFLGTAAVAMLVDDAPAYSERARAIALRMLDYLDETGWVPTNGFNDDVSTVFLTSPTQVLAYYALGNQLDPQRYGAKFDELYPMWSIAWVFPFLQTMDVHTHYYKFNLTNGAALLAGALLPPSERHARIAAGNGMMSHALVNHGNAYFNLVRFATGYNIRSEEVVRAETLGQLQSWLDRPRMMLDLDLRDDTSIDKIEFQPITSRPTGDGPIEVARTALPMSMRVPTNFVWGRSPFELYSKGRPDTRGTGIEFILPYWMARYVGWLDEG